MVVSVRVAGESRLALAKFANGSIVVDLRGIVHAAGKSCRDS